MNTKTGRTDHPAPALCASVAFVAANSTFVNLAANAMFARALLDDHTGEPPTMRTNHVLLAGNDLPHHLLTAMLHQPGRELVLVDSTFDNGAMTLFETDDPGCDPASMLLTTRMHEHHFGDLHHDHGRDATMLTIGGRHKHLGLGAMMMIGDLHHHPDPDSSAIMDSNVHNDEGTDDLNGGGGSIGSDPGEHRMNGNRHLHDAQTDPASPEPAPEPRPPSRRPRTARDDLHRRRSAPPRDPAGRAPAELTRRAT